ncbi:MAG: hypothetical protein Q9166_007756 [cf. Caloplaca sp. 2 TL-2023]
MESIPTAFREMYADPSNERQPEEISKTFYINIKYSEGATTTVRSFLLQHILSRSSGDGSLDTWARGKKLFPWAAVAAPLDHELPRGRLFSCLRLPIETGQPVHIHGLFSIVPDRGRLSSSGQTSRDPGSDWNRFMFKKCVVAVWAGLLVSRRHFAWQQDFFKMWPRLNLSQSGELWSSLDDHIIDRITTRSLPVWNTPNSCVAMEHGFFAPEGDVVRVYGNTFQAINLPLVCLDEHMFEKLLQRASGLSTNVQVLSPGSLRSFLRKPHKLQHSQESSPLLLEYCLQDFTDGALQAELQSKVRNELQGLSLWPTLQESLVALQTEPFLLPRGLEEMALFSSSRKHETLNLKRLTRRTLAFLRGHASSNSNLVRFRTLPDLEVDWRYIYAVGPNNKPGNTCARRSEGDELLRSIWSWICARCEEGSSPLLLMPNLDGLFIMPLNGSRIRKFACSQKSTPTLILEDADWMCELLNDDNSRGMRNADPVLDMKVLPVRAIQLLLSVATKRSDLTLATSSQLEGLLAWLEANGNFVRQLSSNHKKTLTRQLSLLTQQHASSIRDKAKDIFKQQMLQLPIFSHITAAAPYKVASSRTASIGTSSRAIQVINGLPPIPDIPGLAFFEPCDAHEKQLIDFFDLLERVPLDDLFFEDLLPHLEDTKDPRIAQVKLRLIDFVLNNTLRPSDNFKSRFSKCKLVPRSSNPGTENIQFRPLAAMVDPSSLISDLFFEDEGVFPEAGFLKRHHDVLKSCGIPGGLTPEILTERAHNFASSTKGIQRLRIKVKHLLSLPLGASFNMTSIALTELRGLKWLPVSCSSPAGFRMVSPAECRATDEEELVDLVLGVFESAVTSEWKILLGWDKSLGVSILREQLNRALAQGSNRRVDKTLAYLKDLGDCSFLRQLPCILSSHGEYLLPERLLLPGSSLARYPLAPYLSEVEASFAKKHTKLLKTLGIHQNVTSSDVLYVQNKIIESCPSGELSDDDLNAFVSLLEIATRLQEDDKILSAIMIPDTERRLRPRMDIVYGERNVTGKIASFSFVNPRVSLDLVRRLELENSFARATRLGMEFEDEDEDEYTPREKLTTTISDTLGRYSIDSTFSEFLANANDCGATQISWILDPCASGVYGSSALLSEELKGLQGSALFVYNNGVFSERDFQGFKEIGHGGKIDPQQQLLPRNKHWKRKAGVKVSLATARRLFPDQLKPFHGLQGYSMEFDAYDGTLYRLPFRTQEQTLLKETPALIGVEETNVLLEDYYSTAQKSLFFLRSIDAIDFRIRGHEAAWFVAVTRSGGSVDNIFQDISITCGRGSKADHSAVWRIGITDIEEAPNHIVNPGRRANKITECGLAACLKSEGSLDRGQPHQIFCTLPTGFTIRLPVSVHASFAITGDRKTIPFDDTKSSATTAWNLWLLTKCIPEFYLEFLKDLAPRLGEKAFDYWPSTTSVTLNRSFGNVIRDAFWAQLALEQYESYQLFPIVDMKRAFEQSTPLKTRGGGKTRKLFKVTSLKAGQFDALPKEVSAKLSPLFSIICPNLVRPPRQLWYGLTVSNIHQKVTSLESQSICTLFKVDTNCVILGNFLNSLKDDADRDEAAEMVLRIAVPDTSLSSHQSVNGCRIIPKLDSTLGTVRYQNGDTISWPRHDLLFLPTQTEANLFAGCAKSLIKPSLFQKDASNQTSSFALLDTQSHALRNPLVDLVTESSNIRKIALTDIESFLKHVDSSSANVGVNDILDSWIIKFWSYLDPKLHTYLRQQATKIDCASVSNLLKQLKLYDTLIYRYHRGKSWHYVTPQQFEKGPYIIAPFQDRELGLCKLLPGVEMIDPECVPEQLRVNESSLENPQAFSRLLKALDLVGTKKIQGITNESPEYESIRLFRDLIRAYAKSEDVVRNLKVLRSLPIWLQQTPTSPSTKLRCIPAGDAVLCAQKEMLLPCIRERHRFVDPQLVSEYSSTFRSLGCTIMDMESIWSYLRTSLPPKMTPDLLRDYLRCIECLAKSNWKPHSNIAPNGFGILCSPSSLFDHEDEIFLAAFRDPRRHFLHPDFWRKRAYWISLGLRARPSSGSMNDSDFLRCVASIKARLEERPNTDQNWRDAAKITGYLRFFRPGLDSWPRTSWETIVNARMYQASADVASEPTYRQAQMLSLVNQAGPCSIQYATSRNHLRVVWSQRPLLKDPPDAYIYKFVGQPMLVSVFDHLRFLIEIRNTIASSELPEYLKDLQATYSFLQECPTTADLPNIREAKIWLNLPTTHLASISTSQLDGALRSAKSLCFDAPLDTHVVERAKNFLVPYESLLRAVGCQTMVRRSRPNMALPSNNHRRIDHILTVIQGMRKQNELVDVVFEVEGLQISAHRNFMAAASAYCRSQFVGEWGALLGAKPTICIEDLTFKTLSHIVDFAYTGEVSWPILGNADDVNEVADKLDELLDLLRGADMWLMEMLHEHAERYLLDKSETYVRPDNVDSVKELSEIANAKQLVRHCEEFIRDNAQFVQDCRDMKDD